MKLRLIKFLSLLLTVFALAGFGKDPFRKGMDEFEKQNYAGAIAGLTESIQTKPTAQAYFFRGASYSATGKFEEAIQDYTHVLELDPNYENIYWSRGYCYANLRKFEEAIQDYTTSLERDKAEYKPMIYEFRGQSYFFNNQLDESEADLLELLKLNPENAMAQEGLAMIKDARASGAPPVLDWTEDKAREEVFKTYKPTADLSGIPAADPDFEENQKELKKAGGKQAFVKNRYVTVEPNGSYVVSILDERKIPQTTVFYSKDGKTQSTRLYSSPVFPRAAYIYCYSSCDMKDKKAKAGEILSISFHPSSSEFFYFTEDGKMTFHQK